MWGGARSNTGASACTTPAWPFAGGGAAGRSGEDSSPSWVGAIIAYLPTMAIKLIIASGTTVIVAISVGLLIVIFGLFLWFAAYLRQIVGVLIVLLAVVSLITSNLGGFFIGMIFAMVGGSLGFSWVPTEPRIKKWRTRRLLHLPIPAVQPELELRGITTLPSDRARRCSPKQGGGGTCRRERR